MSALCFARPRDVAFAPRQWEPVAVFSDGREVVFPVWSADRRKAEAVALWLAKREGLAEDDVTLAQDVQHGRLF